MQLIIDSTICSADGFFSSSRSIVRIFFYEPIWWLSYCSIKSRFMFHRFQFLDRQSNSTIFIFSAGFQVSIVYSIGNFLFTHNPTQTTTWYFFEYSICRLVPGLRFLNQIQRALGVRVDLCCLAMHFVVVCWCWRKPTTTPCVDENNRSQMSSIFLCDLLNKKQNKNVCGNGEIIC